MRAQTVEAVLDSIPIRLSVRSSRRGQALKLGDLYAACLHGLREERRTRRSWNITGVLLPLGLADAGFDFDNIVDRGIWSGIVLGVRRLSWKLCLSDGVWGVDLLLRLGLAVQILYPLNRGIWAHEEVRFGSEASGVWLRPVHGLDASHSGRVGIISCCRVRVGAW